MSDWLHVLAEACKPPATQAAVAKRIGYSGAVVSAVLKGKYRGDLKAVQSAVEGALMGQAVDCPVIGAIPLQRCAEHQRARFSITNPTRVALARACPSCPHNHSAKRAGDKP